MKNKRLIRLTESDLHRIVRESVNKVLNETDLYDTLARPDGKLDLSNPYTWAKSPEMLKKMGYDENRMKRGKKYYDHQLNPNWKFNKDRRDDSFNFANDRPNGDQRFIRADIREAFRLGRFSCVPTVSRLVNVVLEMLVRNIVITATNHTTGM